MDASAELRRVRERRAADRRRRYRRSRLDRHRAELVELRAAGASYAELALWLRDRRVRVDRTTVRRYLVGLATVRGDGAGA